MGLLGAGKAEQPKQLGTGAAGKAADVHDAEVLGEAEEDEPPRKKG